MLNPVFSNHFLELGQVRHMLSHVCGKNQSDDPLPENLELLSTELICKIVLQVVQYLECRGRMERLLHRNIIAINGPARDLVTMIAVSQPIMTDIMAHCCDNETQAIELV